MLSKNFTNKLKRYIESLSKQKTSVDFEILIEEIPFEIDANSKEDIVKLSNEIKKTYPEFENITLKLAQEKAFYFSAEIEESEEEFAARKKYIEQTIKKTALEAISFQNKNAKEHHAKVFFEGDNILGVTLENKNNKTIDLEE